MMQDQAPCSRRPSAWYSFQEGCPMILTIKKLYDENLFNSIYLKAPIRVFFFHKIEKMADIPAWSIWTGLCFRFQCSISHRWRDENFYTIFPEILARISGASRSAIPIASVCHAALNDLYWCMVFTSSDTETIPGRMTSAPLTTKGIAPASTLPAFRKGNRIAPLKWGIPSRRLSIRSGFCLTRNNETSEVSLELQSYQHEKLCWNFGSGQKAWTRDPVPGFSDRMAFFYQLSFSIVYSPYIHLCSLEKKFALTLWHLIENLFFSFRAGKHYLAWCGSTGCF